MKSSDLAGGAKGEEEYDRTENEQDRGTAGAGAAQRGAGRRPRRGPEGPV